MAVFYLLKNEMENTKINNGGVKMWFRLMDYDLYEYNYSY
jgi:hypothetical protein